MVKTDNITDTQVNKSKIFLPSTAKNKFSHWFLTNYLLHFSSCPSKFIKENSHKNLSDILNRYVNRRKDEHGHYFA